METILADLSVSMSEFKKNPAAVLRQARQRPVAVLSHNSPAFYMLEPRLYEALLDALADRQLEQTVLSRLAERAQAIEVDVDTV
ncbi:MAG: type II toxin-antitoxin system Phd/YefM family antitoxin [Hylemonella sp.]